MVKAVLVMDTPDNCYQCGLWHVTDKNVNYCGADFKVIYPMMNDERPDWCPLIPEPERLIAIHSATGYDELSWNHGWNACLDVLDKKNGCQSNL